MLLFFKRFYCIVLFYTSVCCAYAQEKTPDSSDTNQEKAIITYPNKISFRLALNNDFNSFEIKDPSTGFGATIEPNQELKTNFSVLFRFIELNIGFIPSFLDFNNDNDSKGKTTFFNLGTRFYFKKWMQSLEWSRTKGYYVDLPGINENVLFPDFKIFRIGGTTSYIFNDSFSFRAIFKQNEWQRISQGSFVPTLTYFYTEISNGEDSGEDKSFDITIGPSYFYNWVINKRFLVSGGVHGGIGYTNTHSQASHETYSGINYQADVKLGLGYNIDSFFTGIHYNYRSFYHNTDSSYNLKDQHSFLEFHVGYRFDAPKKWVDKIDKIENKYGL
ncbi:MULTISPECIES: DUF4421 family protein [Galbibacter]|uniref:DUF4421 family protein n=1 Tax=Galbibacter pacificus TaxID=2996052 RepID=A0ABT6FS78_9FLAO|nr:DUF4421 family protein [Galbibacter pacificus]MDG3582759.1 DUF4421 family protein [Galbibacter pacificus]MDG3586122.1 DUF4421 family protein [Galbibacter pacificus]